MLVTLFYRNVNLSNENYLLVETRYLMHKIVKNDCSKNSFSKFNLYFVPKILVSKLVPCQAFGYRFKFRDLIIEFV